MSAEPYTPAELEVAVKAHCWPHQVRAVLAAVLPDHDAQVRADERAQCAQQLRQIADQAEATWIDTDPNREIIASYRAMADVIARAHATTPTTEEDPNATT